MPPRISIVGCGLATRGPSETAPTQLCFPCKFSVRGGSYQQGGFVMIHPVSDGPATHSRSIGITIHFPSSLNSTAQFALFIRTEFPWREIVLDIAVHAGPFGAVELRFLQREVAPELVE
jgi:hypothetical protein